MIEPNPGPCCTPCLCEGAQLEATFELQCDSEECCGCGEIVTVVWSSGSFDTGPINTGCVNDTLGVDVQLTAYCGADGQFLLDWNWGPACGNPSGSGVEPDTQDCTEEDLDAENVECCCVAVWTIPCFDSECNEGEMTVTMTACGEHPK